jgi:hypothetical protein
MRNVKAKLGTVVVVLSTFATPAVGCTFDSDCSPGSKCERPSGRIVGMCSGGQFPGNQYDLKPYFDPFDRFC